jgi:hypothetical protein
LLVAAVLALASCGSGGESAATDPPATDPPATAAPTTDPPVTDPAVTEPPVTTPPATDPPVTDPPMVELDEFCAASEAFFVPSHALDFLAENDPAGIERLFADMQEALSAAVDTAPTAELAKAPTRVVELFDIVVPALESLDYDVTRFPELADQADVGAALLEIDEIDQLLETFLVDECGLRLADLEGEAEVRATEVGSGVDSPSVDLESIEVTDDSSTISVKVPVEWTDVDGTPTDGDLASLAAAADVDVFLDGYAEPGVLIIVGAAKPGDEAWKDLADSATAAAEADGCSVVAGIPYDEGAYNGVETVLDCPDSDMVPRYIVGTNADETIFFFLAMVHPDGATEIRTLIVDSFVVD